MSYRKAKRFGGGHNDFFEVNKYTSFEVLTKKLLRGLRSFILNVSDNIVLRGVMSKFVNHHR